MFPPLVRTFLTRFGPWILVGLVALFVFTLGNRIVREWHEGIVEQTNLSWEKKLAEAQLEQAKAAQAIADMVDQRLTKKLADLEIEQRPILREINNETHTDTVYRDVTISDRMFQNLNALGTRGGTAAGASGAQPAGAAAPAAP